MRKIALIAAVLLAPALAGAQQGGQLLDLSAIEGLAAIGHADLAGVFSFVPEKNTAEAFADLLLRDLKSQKKYVAKLDDDFKVAGGITLWDRAVLQDVVSAYGSPMGGSLKKPSAKAILHMAGLVSAPSMTIEQIESKRRGGR